MSLDSRPSGTQSPPRPSLPREVEGFRLLRELGRGGMGVVYEAEERASGRIVALKVLASELRVSEEAFGRFQQEARLAAAISDPACVFVYGAHSIEGSPAIAMELCGGETLEARLRRPEPIPIETAVRWTIEILDGLEAAHEAGVVHRDVKPSNCFQTADGRAKIGDFGLARTLERDVGLTQSGAFLGSPLYASPEQVRGRQVDLRSDIYSCAATLYALLTGRPPHSGGGVGEVLARILSEPVDPPRSIRAEIPRGLERAVLKAMSKEPGDRYKSFAAFRKALSPFETSTREPARRGLRIAAYMVDYWLVSLLEGLPLLASGFEWLHPERSYVTTLPLALMGVAIPMLYFGLFEGLTGATPGKWLFGLRVVAVGGGQPHLGRALARAFVFFLSNLLPHFVLVRVPDLGPQWGGLAAVSLQGLAHVLLLSSMRRANGWRGLHELASGTRAVQVHIPFQRARPALAPPEQALGPAPTSRAQVGAYAIEGLVGETPAGRILRGRDPELGRSVWILERSPGGEWDDARRTLERRGRLRWLASSREGEVAFEVFEDPGGSSLPALAAGSGPLAWPTTLRLLRELSEELEDQAPEAPVHLEQVWVDRSWHLRLLDRPLRSGAEVAPSAPHAPVGLLGACARALLHVEAKGERLPTDLPLHAEEPLERLVGRGEPFRGAGEARAALDSLLEKAQGVPRNARLTQLALSTAVPVAAFLIVMFFAAFSMVVLREDVEALRLLNAMEKVEKVARESGEAEEPDPELLAARQTVIAAGFQGQVGASMLSNLSQRQHELRAEALERFGDASAEAVEAARALLRERDERYGRTLTPAGWCAIAGSIAGTVFGGWGLISVLVAFATAGGLSLRLAGLGLRTSRGRRAPRWRAALRAFAAWAPVCGLLWASAFLGDEAGGWLAPASLLATAIGLGLGGLAFAAWASAPSLQDRVAGTRLVPR